MRAEYVLLIYHIQIKLFFELKKGWLGGILQWLAKSEKKIYIG